MGRKEDIIRSNFRKACHKRDNNRCVMCGTSKSEVERLDVHHITDRNEMPNGGYVPENGISLCPSCHLKAELYHQTNGWDWEQGFHPNSLYFRIGSSYEKAKKASKEKLE